MKKNTRHSDLRVRLSDREREVIEAAAAAEGHAVSAWVRSVALKKARGSQKMDEAKALRSKS